MQIANTARAFRQNQLVLAAAVIKFKLGSALARVNTHAYDSERGNRAMWNRNNYSITVFVKPDVVLGLTKKSAWCGNRHD